MIGISRNTLASALRKPGYQIVLTGLYILAVVALAIAVDIVVAGAYSTFVPIFLSILIEAMPFLLAGALVSGLIHVFVDQQLLLRLIPRHPLRSSAGDQCVLGQKFYHGAETMRANTIHYSRRLLKNLLTVFQRPAINL